MLGFALRLEVGLYHDWLSLVFLSLTKVCVDVLVCFVGLVCLVVCLVLIALGPPRARIHLLPPCRSVRLTGQERMCGCRLAPFGALSYAYACMCAENCRWFCWGFIFCRNLGIPLRILGKITHDRNAARLSALSFDFCVISLRAGIFSFPAFSCCICAAELRLGLGIHVLKSELNCTERRKCA